MNSAIKDLQRNFRQHHLIVILGAIVLIWAIYQYSTDKGFFPEKFGQNGPQHGPQMPPASSAANAGTGYQPSSGMQGNEYEDVTGIQGPSVSAPSCTKGAVATPGDLLPNMNMLPKDPNSQWAQLNPSGSGDLMNQNLLSAGFLAGIDTIGNTMKNPNLQIRSEPPNPQLNVGPWNNSTFSPDLMRTPLEIGCGSQ
jgi:hypothetical protein